MDNLPAELLLQILNYLPASDLPTMRLVSQSYSVLAFKPTFSYLLNWLDFSISHQKIISLAHDVHNRPAVMWSPWASQPDRAVDNVFMVVVWKLLVEKDFPGGFPPAKSNQIEEFTVLESTCAIPHLLAFKNSQAKKQDLSNKSSMCKDGGLTTTNFAELSGKEDMTENRLKTGQNRLLLWRSYADEAGKEKHWGAC